MAQSIPIKSRLALWVQGILVGSIVVGVVMGKKLIDADHAHADALEAQQARVTAVEQTANAMSLDKQTLREVVRAFEARMYLDQAEDELRAYNFGVAERKLAAAKSGANAIDDAITRSKLQQFKVEVTRNPGAIIQDVRALEAAIDTELMERMGDLP